MLYRGWGQAGGSFFHPTLELENVWFFYFVRGTGKKKGTRNIKRIPPPPTIKTPLDLQKCFI